MVNSSAWVAWNSLGADSIERLVEAGLVQHWKQQAVVLAAAAAPHNFDTKRRASSISLTHLQVYLAGGFPGAATGGGARRTGADRGVSRRQMLLADCVWKQLLTTVTHAQRHTGEDATHANLKGIVLSVFRLSPLKNIHMIAVDGSHQPPMTPLAHRILRTLLTIVTQH
ncbi:hypothetical protein E2C01_003896 [Portunus trituberculatus]|uniref:Uncharacterized protein n=1 Tax=Portunus trituberculatus TaxID=210409 RepID=A0A5B7CRE6_PORTR|nr:hypothetical protein [Portunus trituberculatus]